MSSGMALSTRADPFDVAREEVEAAVRKVQFMHKEWRRLLDSQNTAENTKFQDLHAELVGELELLSHDLADMERSIQTAEENRERFNLSEAQLRLRRDYVQKSRAAHKELQDQLNDRSVSSKMEEDRRRALLSKESQVRQQEQRRHEQDNHIRDEAFLQEQRQLQEQYIRVQDDDLDELSKNAQGLGALAQTLNGEIEAQNKMLEALGDDIDAETARMNVVMQGVGKLLKSSNKLEIYGMMGLVGLFLFLTFLIFNT